MQNPSQNNLILSPDHPYYASIFDAFPQFRFKKGKKFAYHPPKTITVGPPEPHSELLLLHEVSHAVLQHSSFLTDIERLKMESNAWKKAEELAIELKIPFNSDFAQDRLDSYRDWLHARSLCKKCGITRYQTPDGKYHCPSCGHIR